MDRIFRLALITEILESQFISNQDDLQQALSNKGVNITQATLSRDLKTLRAARITSSDGGSRYVIQDTPQNNQAVTELPDHLDGVKSIEFSGQLGVVRTLPGFANAVAYYIDQADIQEFMGTIAGDDTILLIGRAGYTENQLAGIFVSNFSGIANRIK